MKIKKPTPAATAITTIALVLALALVPAAFAGKGKPGGGGGGGSSSLSLVLSTDLNSNGVPNWDDTITYNVSTTATSGPQVSTACYQDGALVLQGNAAFYDGNPFAYMDLVKLATGAWTGGSADCTAKMYYMSGKRTITLATLAFHVDA